MYVERGNGDRTKNDKKEKTVRFSTLKTRYVKKKAGATPTRSTYFFVFRSVMPKGSSPFSLYFLLQPLKKGRIEEVADRELKSISDLLNGRHRGGIVATADDIIQGRLRDPRDRGKLIQRNIILAA